MSEGALKQPVQPDGPDAKAHVREQAAGDERGSTSLVEHCQLAHFTLLLLCVAMLVALTADPDRQLTESIRDLNRLLQFRGNWKELTARTKDAVGRVQREGTMFEVSATVPIDGQPTDILLMLDLKNTWVPHHRDLYDRSEPHAHTNRLIQPGESVAEFAAAWDWATQLAWVFIPSEPGPLLTLTTIERDGRVIHLDQTTTCTVTRVQSFSQDRSHGSNDTLLMLDAAVDRAGSLPFGPFPHDYSSVPNKGTLTLRGSSGPPPPVEQEVTLQMHLDKSITEVRTFVRGPDGRSLDKGRVKSVGIRIPLVGVSENVAPLVHLADQVGMPTVPAKTFALQFPAAARLPNAYQDLSPEQCLRVLEEQRGTLSEKTLSIAGVEIPLSFIVRWGQVVLLCALGYLIVHGMEARRRLTADPTDPGWSVPWLPLYGTLTARLLTWLTAVALPLGVGALALWRSWPAAGGLDRAGAILLSLLVLLAALVVWAVLRLLAYDAATRRVTSTSTPARPPGGGAVRSRAIGFVRTLAARGRPRKKPKDSQPAPPIGQTQ